MYKFVLLLILFVGINNSTFVDYIKQSNEIDKICFDAVRAQTSKEETIIMMHKFCFFSVYHCLTEHDPENVNADKLKQCLMSKLSNDFNKILYSSINSEKKTNDFCNNLFLLILFFFFSGMFLFLFYCFY